MPNTSHSLLDYLRTVSGAWRNDPRSDADLVARFVGDRNEDAFQVMVWRHGPMVWRTCQRILGDSPDAQDAFQATFLALSCEAGRIRVENLAGWLHRVARRSSLDSDKATRRRKKKERLLRPEMQPEMK